tara:strand:- start:8810 stop:9712 length:903 start_codon:yes stop_codon:yes gene_type:complete
MLSIRPETIIPPLKRGDEFTIVAASSIINDEISLLNGLETLNEWGLVCRSKIFKRKPWGYLASSDEKRFNELHYQEKTSLITFARGGWGAARLLERNQPWRTGYMIGFSDVSSILLSRLAAGFYGGIHGPLLTSLHNEPNWSKERLRRLLFGERVPDLYGEPWVKGVATGPLVVTNLTVASHLLGSSHMPNLNGAVLILEDTGEAPYRIDRMLTHWRLAGLLQDLAGLAFGSFSNCMDDDQSALQNNFTLEEILKERCFDLNIPVIGNLLIGHCQGNAAMPIGKKVILDGNKGRVSLYDD